MSKCPYTWLKGFFIPSSQGEEPSQLRVSVTKLNQLVVDVALPARSARWLMDLIPTDVLAKIRQEGIPIDEIQADLESRAALEKKMIFDLNEESRRVQVWLE